MTQYRSTPHFGYKNKLFLVINSIDEAFKHLCLMLNPNYFSSSFEELCIIEICFRTSISVHIEFSLIMLNSGIMNHHCPVMNMDPYILGPLEWSIFSSVAVYDVKYSCMVRNDLWWPKCLRYHVFILVITLNNVIFKSQ